MYNNNIFRKIGLKLGLFRSYILVLTIIIFFIFIAYRLYSRAKTQRLEKDDKVKFSKLIHTYALKTTPANDEQCTLMLQTYNFNPANKSEIFGDIMWQNNAENFGNVITQIQGLMVASLVPKSVAYRNKKVWKIVEHFLNTVRQRLPTSPNPQRFPWGQNWYQFSITFPRFVVLAAYLHIRMYNKEHPAFMSHLRFVVNKYIPSPTQSLGWNRYGPNAVMMCVWYVGGHILMGDVNKKNEGVEYVKNYLKLEKVGMGEGLRADGGFVFHSTLRAYGYLTSALEDFALLCNFFDIPSMSKIYNALDKIEHPKFKVHFGPWFSRTKSLHSSYNGKYGFDVIKSVNIICVKTPTYYLGFNAQSPSLCYYEADQSNRELAQVWTMARMFLYDNSEMKLYKEFITHYPGVISFNNEIIELRSETSTTTTFMPDQAESMICKLDNAIGVYNSYSINRLFLTVVELMLITELGYHVFYTIQPDIQELQSKTVLVSVNLGRLENNEGNGLGKAYKFEENTTFVYSSVDPDHTTILHPEKNKTLTSLQVKAVNQNGEYLVSFSTLHSNKNEVVEIPSNTQIKTEQLCLKYDVKNKSLLLYNYDERSVVVATSSKRQTISKVYANKHFGDDITLGRGTLVNDEYVLMNQDGTEQMMFSNVDTSLVDLS